MVVRGDMEPLSWVTGPTDSPVASGEAVRTLLFSGEISGEPETIATCDARNAFRQTQPFGPDDPVRYVAYKAHKHAKLRVFRMLSSQYGCTDASMRWYNTLVPYLTEQGFVRGENDKCVFVHPESKIRVAIHVDYYLVRGVRLDLIRFSLVCVIILHTSHLCSSRMKGKCTSQVSGLLKRLTRTDIGGTIWMSSVAYRLVS